MCSKKNGSKQMTKQVVNILSMKTVLCDYSDPYIVVKRTITVEGDNNPKKRNKKVTFNNNVSFRSCISKNQ